MKKLSNYLKDNETITLAELYKRVYNDSGCYRDWVIFEKVARDDNSVEVIPYTDHSPMFIKKRKTFFEKVLDILKHLCYN